MRPIYEMLYAMDDPLASQPIRLEPYDDDWLGQREAVGLLRGEFVPPRVLKLRPAMGGKFVDLMWSTFTPIRVVSQRLVSLLLAKGLTGLSTYEVQVQNRNGLIEADYRGLVITGRAAKRDLRRVQVIQKPPRTSGGAPYTDLKGLYFENDGWDASDFCLVGNSLTIIVSDRVVQAFAKSKIRNVRFTPLPDVETPASVYEVLGLWPPS